jgi:Putative motility protein
MVDSVSEVQNAALAGKISIALLKKQQDTQQAQGDAVVDMLEDAAKLAKSGGKVEPGSLDLYA